MSAVTSRGCLDVGRRDRSIREPVGEPRAWLQQGRSRKQVAA